MLRTKCVSSVRVATSIFVIMSGLLSACGGPRLAAHLINLNQAIFLAQYCPLYSSVRDKFLPINFKLAGGGPNATVSPFTVTLTVAYTAEGQVQLADVAPLSSVSATFTRQSTHELQLNLEQATAD